MYQMNQGLQNQFVAMTKPTFYWHNSIYAPEMIHNFLYIDVPMLI